MSCVSNIVIVLDESFREEYSDIVSQDPRIIWADPGVERQVSEPLSLTILYTIETISFSCQCKIN